MSDIDYLFISELIRQEERAHCDHSHNLEIDEIVSTGETILSYCLEQIASSPEKLEQEGAVNALIRKFIQSRNGWSYFVKDSHGNWYQHTGLSEPTRISYAPIDQDSIPDLVINADAMRIELKSVALFTPKDRIPADFFSKDLEHIAGEFEFDRFDFEGASRAYRQAEMCLLIGDLDVIINSEKLTDLLGENFLSDTSAQYLRDHGVNGTRFEIRTVSFKSPKRSQERKLCGILAFPGKKAGQRT